MRGQHENNAQYFRQSETAEQQDYEQSMFKGHHNEATHYTNDQEEHVNEREHHSSGHRIKDFWNDTVKSAFPEAVADIKIVKEAIKVRASIKNDITDSTIYPEILKVAEVRRGLELAAEEQKFLALRKGRVRDSFAKYLNLDPANVHPDDVPIVAMGGSGGGFRAMIGILGYTQEMKRSGLWDLLTYVAGVSGACWFLAAYYTSGDADADQVLDNWKSRLHPHHPLSGQAIRALLTTPDGPYVTLGPLAQKHHSGLATVAMDLYSVFTTGHLFVRHDPHIKEDVAGHRQNWYKWSSAAVHLEGGQEPLPIITAIRHERPWKDWKDKDDPFSEPDHTATEHSNAKNAWFQWFEMTPFEVGCDELEAFVPIWGFGRPFKEGKSTMQLPEQSLALLLGLATGAPAGPLTSYLSTIKRQLPPGFVGKSMMNIAKGVSDLWGQHGTEEFESHHPMHASNEHNFMFHLTKLQKGEIRPRGLENSPRIHLVDSGMDNNCPTYVLLHPNRNVDVILNMDASSDVQKDSFSDRANQIGFRRGLKFTKKLDIKPGADTKDPDRFKGMYAQIYNGTICERPATVLDSYGNTVTNPPAPTVHKECTIVYMPLLPNERVVPDFDPSTAKFSGSYNLVWTPEQIEMLLKVCVQNVKDGEETIKTALTDAWMRKKAARESGGAAGLDTRGKATEEGFSMGDQNSVGSMGPQISH